LVTLLYSLIESVKLAGVEPRAYLAEAERRAIRNPGTVTLPRDIKWPASTRILTGWIDGGRIPRVNSWGRTP
jgi:hypothetical protein